MILAKIIFPFTKAYVGHVGLGIDDAQILAELKSRLSVMAWWIRVYAAMGALFVRWLAPAVVIGRWKRFDALSDEDRETLLLLLQNAHHPALKGIFVGVKFLNLAVCYARPEALSWQGSRTQGQAGGCG